MKTRIALIGAGMQGRKYMRLLESAQVEIDSVVDVSPDALRALVKATEAPLFESVADMLAFRRPDVALICTPHHAQRAIVAALAAVDVPMIKEKPFAMTVEEAEFYEGLRAGGARIAVSTRRRFDPVYRAVESALLKIRPVISFDLRYFKNVPDLGEGWRALKAEAGGGALIDMGYHMVDLVTWWFGQPDMIASSLSYGNRQRQHYDVEDTADAWMQFRDRGRVFSGHLSVSRVSATETEEIVITGAGGQIIVTEAGFRLYRADGALDHEIAAGKSSATAQRMLEELSAALLRGQGDALQHGLEQTKLVARIYDAREKREAEPDYSWPVITDAVRERVADQLGKTISIYGRSGIFEKFEDRWAARHARAYALLTNSGTAAIHSMYEALDLRPGDEVLVPCYTFHATVSPIVFTGAKPVPIDCGPDGNMDPALIEAAITERTRAIIVTHMWGIPCEMAAIAAIARRRGLVLLEDCSHAHGASYRGVKCGAFGDMAAWSLQGEKIISGGEGGILVADKPEHYHRALLLGHYNKRPKSEIPASSPLHPFFLTGLGLKLRAHPLAIAMADEQLDHLDEWLALKNARAAAFSEMLSALPAIILPNTANRVPAWYAYVFQVDEAKSGGVTARQVHAALQAEGLREADMPGSTGPIHKLPLFTRTPEVMGRLYREPCIAMDASFPGAERFARQAIKYPVWAMEEDAATVDLYRDKTYAVLKSLLRRG